MISVILPIGQNERRERIKRCLDSLACQTYKDFEVIIVTFPHTFRTLSSLFPKYSFIKVLTGTWNKSGARNYGAKKAKGGYLLHHEVDMELPPTLLSEYIKKAGNGAVAIIAWVKWAKKVNFWGKCRALEMEIFLGDPILITPMFIKKSVFERIGGFDQDLDPLDDWGLHLALKEKGVKFDHIKSKITLHESPTLKEIIRRMYERGQALPALQQKYPDLPQIKIANKVKIYQKNWRLLRSSPLLALGLFFLKMIDFIAFSLGMRHPQRPYTLAWVADEYERKRLGSNFTRYKHFVECQALFRLLGPNPGKILEVGCGTGRITRELIKRGYQVTPLDPSEAMLKQFKKKKGLPKPIKASGNHLSFKENQFKTVFALRVIWHLPYPQQKTIIKEISRVASKTVILDIANQKRCLAPFLLGPLTYPTTLKSFLTLCQQNQLRLEKSLPLEVSLPIWLNLLPEGLARKLFPFLKRLDLFLARIVSPGRYLLKMEKIKKSLSFSRDDLQIIKPKKNLNL